MCTVFARARTPERPAFKETTIFPNISRATNGREKYFNEKQVLCEIQRLFIPILFLTSRGGILVRLLGIHVSYVYTYRYVRTYVRTHTHTHELMSTSSFYATTRIENRMMKAAFHFTSNFCDRPTWLKFLSRSVHDIERSKVHSLRSYSCLERKHEEPSKLQRLVKCVSSGRHTMHWKSSDGEGDRWQWFAYAKQNNISACPWLHGNSIRRAVFASAHAQPWVRANEEIVILIFRAKLEGDKQVLTFLRQNACLSTVCLRSRDERKGRSSS